MIHQASPNSALSQHLQAPDPLPAGPLWIWVEAASRLLQPVERDAVLGDLLEAEQSAWRSLLDICGLVLHRQLAHWKSWRPWLAAFGLALPGSFFLMGFSLSVSWSFQHAVDAIAGRGPLHGAGPWPLILDLLVLHLLPLVAWSWTGGFVIGSISRQTLWVSVLACCSPCLYCLSKFRVESLSPLCLVLFLLPALWGVRQGLSRLRFKLSTSIGLAVTVTALSIPSWSSRGAFPYTCALIWPAWYLVATARKSL